MKLLFVITVLFISIGLGRAQVTPIPDPAFETALISLGLDTAPVNGFVNTASIDTVSNLAVGHSFISDLSGIEGFISLIELDCAGNALDSLDLSQNTLLVELDCRENQIEQLIITQSPDLLELDCSDNELNSLDVSQNTILRYLNCYSNNLTTLDIDNLAALNTLNCYLNSLVSLDPTNNPLLENLNCYDNELSTLNLSQNSLIDYLNCSENNLTVIDFSQNPLLQQVRINDNQLIALNVLQNPALKYLVCSNNQITELNFSQNVLLTAVYCTNNNLSCMNMRNGNLSPFFISADLNPNLGCIEVYDPSWCAANLTLVDPNSAFSESCANMCTTVNVENELLESFVLYPNPANNGILNLSGIPLGSTYNIYNTLGQLTQHGDATTQLEVNNLNVGIYQFVLMSGNQSVVKKLIIQ